MGEGWSRREFLGAVVAGSACTLLPTGVLAKGPRPERVPGWVLRDVRLVDGTGQPSQRTDVLVRGDRIERIGRIGKDAARGLRVVDGGGRVLAPGFIDLHTHGDPLAEAYTQFLAMGVTTIVLGQDGGSPSLPDQGRNAKSLPDYLDAVARAQPDVNVASLSGHGALRRRAGIDDGTRKPSDRQLSRLQAILEQDLRAGAFGLSTGLEYVPGRYAEARELASLGPVVARHQAVAMSHMRNEDADQVRASIREFVDNSGPARAHISHLKMVYGRGADAGDALLGFIQSLRTPSQPLTADAYPYEASYTGVGILFPEWALPPSDYASVVQARGGELRDYLQRRMEQRGGPRALLFGTGPHAGKTLARVASELDQPFADALVQIGPGGGQAAHFVMDRRLQDELLLDPHVALGSDGSPGGSHPRSAGTFAKWIEAFVIEQPRVTIEEAVRKATSLPASILGLADRGVIRAGAKADLLLFDPAHVHARADYVAPTAMAEGFDLVLVNGQAAFGDARPGVRAGRLLRRGG